MSTSFKPELDFKHAVSNLQIKGFKKFNKFGYNPNLSSGAEAVVWTGPTDDYIFPSDTGETMELASDNIADTQLIAIMGLDANWDEITLTVNLNGTTAVALSQPLARINRIVNIDSTEFIGEVTVSATGAGTVFAIALAADQITTQIVFSVPRGYSAQLETPVASLNKSGGSVATVIFRTLVRGFGGVFILAGRFGLSSSATSALAFPVEFSDVAGPKSDIIVKATADANTTDVSARYPFILSKV